jgi:hypothetical protein
VWQSVSLKWIQTVATRKPKYRVTPVEAQRRRLAALDRWFQFVNGERAVTPDNFGQELLVPTAWGLERKLLVLMGAPLTANEMEEIKVEIAAGLRQLAEKREWVISGAELGHFNIVISQIGTSYEGAARPQSLLGISALLQPKEEWRAGICAWCGKLFPKRKRSEYCKLQCSQRMRTFKARNPHWNGQLKAAIKAKQPIATYLLAQRKEPVRLVSTCPVCGHQFEVPGIPRSVQCPGHKGYFIAGSLNTKSSPLKGTSQPEEKANG